MIVLTCYLERWSLNQFIYIIFTSRHNIEIEWRTILEIRRHTQKLNVDDTSVPHYSCPVDRLHSILSPEKNRKNEIITHRIYTRGAGAWPIGLMNHDRACDRFLYTLRAAVIEQCVGDEQIFVTENS